MRHLSTSSAPFDSGVRPVAQGDIAALLARALQHLGCERASLGAFDAHSPIELSFEDAPSLFFVPEEDGGATLACDLGACSDFQLDTHARALLDSVMKPVAWAAGGHVHLDRDGENLWLRAALTAQALTSETLLGDALVDFYGSVSDLRTRMQ